MPGFVQKKAILVLAGALLALTGCEKLERLTRGDVQKKQLQLGSECLAARDFRGAVSAFESAIDGTPRTAEAHFRLGLIYHDHLQDPLGAIHHFRRYLEIDPQGTFSRQARANIARAEQSLATGLSGGTLLGRQEATRIRSENLQLKQQLAVAKSAAGLPAGKGKPTPPPSASAEDLLGGAGVKPAPGSADQRAATAAVKEAERQAQAATRSYKVQPGDTLAGISRKFYQTSNRANDLLDANMNALDGDATKLRAGMMLIIP